MKISLEEFTALHKRMLDPIAYSNPHSLYKDYTDNMLHNTEQYREQYGQFFSEYHQDPGSMNWFNFILEVEHTERLNLIKKASEL